MLKKILKWVAIVLGVIVGIVVIAAVAVTIISNSKTNKEYDVAGVNLTIPTDEASIEEGGRLAAIRGCTDCHVENLSGQLLIDDPALGTFYTSNITSGSGGQTSSYTAADWDLAIRHGIGQDGKPLFIMPSAEYNGISDEDLAMMIAYLQSVDPVDQEWPESSPGPLGRVLVVAGQIPYAAEVIDHSVLAPVSVVREVSAEYGGYLAQSCTGCHGVDFAGGPAPGASSDDPEAANLTPAGNLANWNQEAFINSLRTGQTPEGGNLDPDFMPWPITSQMTDDELAAVWLFLSSLPAVETG